jgi:hypothetical protein
MTRRSDPPTSEGMSVEEAKAFLAREGQTIGGEPEEGQEVTRTLATAELGVPAEDEPNTLQLAPPESLPADIEGPTVQRTVVLDKPAPAKPAIPSLIGDDLVPITEGTALLPRSVLSGAPPAPTATPPLPPAAKFVTRNSEPKVRSRPWLVGVIVFGVSLIVFGAAAVAFIWQSL